MQLSFVDSLARLLKLPACATGYALKCPGHFRRDPAPVEAA
jgi:hypothetical protein